MIRYIGLDFEATGSDPWGAHAPIQIGMVVMATPDSQFDPAFESLIGGWHLNGKRGEWEWDEEAAKVHNIPREDVKRGGRAPSVHEVDVTAAAWMYRLGLRNRMWNITVGWNVAGYDRQFVTRHFPNLNRLLSYRTVDLNALVFSRSGGDQGRFMDIKASAKQYADKRLGLGPKDRHNALTDARAALLEFEFLSKVGEDV